MSIDSLGWWGRQGDKAGLVIRVLPVKLAKREAVRVSRKHDAAYLKTVRLRDRLRTFYHNETDERTAH